MKELVLSYSRAETDPGQSQQTLYGFYGFLGIVGAVEKIEEAQSQCRCERKVAAKRWKF
jgi:hypothetical protein